MRNHCVVAIATAATAAIVSAITLIGNPQPALAQAPDPRAEGRTHFLLYCASCHGESGTGNGPAANAMRHMPPDLTGLALANGGVFPDRRMRRIVDGRDVEAHGDRDMPVWGDAFKADSGRPSNDAVRNRIETILKYLASIQRRAA